MQGIPLDGPETAKDSLYLPTDISPEELFQAIGRLRKEARAEVHRLIQFLDKTDDYVSREVEEDNDDEATGDEEPSLGSFDQMTDQSKSWRQGHLSGKQGNRDDCEGDPLDAGEDEHDGAEPDEADNEPSAGFDHGFGADEPNLGWTVDGFASNTSEASVDRELQDHAALPRVQRLAAGVSVEDRFCGRKTIRGLTDPQKAAVKGKMDRHGTIALD